MKTKLSIKYFIPLALLIAVPFLSGCDLFKKGSGVEPIAYEINGKRFSLDQVQKANVGPFYEIEKKKAELIQDLAKKAYLDEFFSEMGSKENKSKEEAQKDYLAANIQITDQEIEEALQRLGNKPNFASMTDEQKRKLARNNVEQTKKDLILKDITDKAINEKKLVIFYQAPEKPRYKLNVTSDEFIRFGPGADDINPMAPNGCKGDDCAVTVVEYSDFQCPYCKRIAPIANQLLEKYKGKVRWVARSFPIASHPKARPAAIAAACAGQQKKFWPMYETLFANQQALEKQDLLIYADMMNFDMNQFNACFNAPDAINKKIDQQMKFGQDLGVTSVPTFFINGRKVIGAKSYEVFEKIIEEELAKIKQ